MSWFAVDASGRDLATGSAPAGAGHATAAAALAAAPVVTWPVYAVDSGGQRVGLGAALGRGGDRVEHLLGALVGGHLELDEADVASLARATPAGDVALPVDVVDLPDAVNAAAGVEGAFLAEMERQRAEVRQEVVDQGRSAELEAALHVVLLVGTEYLDPAGDDDVDAHVASGGRLWLLAGAVVSALAGWAPDAFAPWGWLLAARYWPVGPCGGRLVVGHCRLTPAPARP